MEVTFDGEIASFELAASDRVKIKLKLAGGRVNEPEVGDWLTQKSSTETPLEFEVDKRIVAKLELGQKFAITIKAR